MMRQCREYIEHNRTRITNVIEERHRERINSAADSVADRIISKLNETADALCNSIINRAHLIAYWEQVLLTGAKDLLDDLRSDKPCLGHLVE
jgi:hypothetical protein